jgi:hypothetical protein
MGVRVAGRASRRESSPRSPGRAINPRSAARTPSSGGETTRIEREIFEQIAVAGLRLRFDAVVRRLIDRLRSDLTKIVAKDQTLLFTVTAPIRVPGKTADALQRRAREAIEVGEWRGNLCGNAVRIRRLAGVAPRTPRVMGLVHNPEVSAARILALVESQIRS